MVTNNRIYHGMLSDITQKILEYKKEKITNASGGSYIGLRRLLPYVDRHYYINLRTRLCSEANGRDCVQRDMWMYFPHSHIGSNSSWPDLDKLKTSGLEDFKEHKFPDNINEFNKVNFQEDEYGFPFNKTGITYRAISGHNEYRYEIQKFKKFCTEEVNGKIRSFFEDKHECPFPNDYDPFLWGIEKTLIYDDFPSDKMWIYYPLSFMGVFVSILCARIPEEKLDEVAQILPVIGGSVSEKLLSRYMDHGQLAPLMEVNSSTSGLSLMSVVAAQCGLTEVEYTQQQVHFFRKNNKSGDQTHSIRFGIGPNISGFLFSLPDHDVEYFRVLENIVSPYLRRYSELIDKKNKHAEAAIMARNLSHNIGSHVISSSGLISSVGGLSNTPPSNDEEGNIVDCTELDAYKAGASLKRFNSYLQGRLDFIARSLSGKDLPEPVYFLNDLLDSFLMQGVLLQNLLADLGYTADKIVFHVRVNNGKFAEYHWDNKEKIYIKKNNIELMDVLIGVPGGGTGAQAFYGFLENVMRNAAKYGQKKDKFHLYLSLHQCRYDKHDHSPTDQRPAGSAWILSIWENLSNGMECCDKIRKLIELPLVDDNGDTTNEGHGIQEMKLCADYLAFDRSFPPDEGGYSYNSHCLPCSYKSDVHKGCQPTCNYCGGISGHGYAIQSRYPLRCYPLNENGHKALCYDLIIPAAIILGVVGLEEPESGPEHESASFYSSIKELASQNPQFAVIVDQGDRDIRTDLEEIGKYHPALPFRLMVLVQAKERRKAWESAIEQFDKPSDRKDKNLTLGGWIPENRIRLVVDNDLMSALQSPDSAKFLGCKGWEAVMLQVYDAWLRAYKGEELKDTKSDKWRLLIGFDHGGEQILPRWNEKACQMFRADEGSSKSVIALDVFASDSQSRPALEESINNEAVVAYDNHGRTLTLTGNLSAAKCASYHEFGLNKGLALYQSLSSPPQSRFGVGYFVYSLVESALTRVFVLDERFAGAMAMEGETNILDEPIHSVVKSCRMNPVFAIRKDKDDVEPDNISPIVDGPFSFDMDRYKLVNAESEPQPVDVFVIHEGVLDKQTSESAKVKWNRERDTWRLFQVAPMVVRCSGRGAETRQLDDRISFVEFNHVSKNTYIEINKLGLVKSLLGSGGHMNKEGRA